MRQESPNSETLSQRQQRSRLQSRKLATILLQHIMGRLSRGPMKREQDWTSPLFHTFDGTTVSLFG